MIFLLSRNIIIINDKNKNLVKEVTMAVSVNTIAQQLHLSPEELIQRSLLSFLDREKRTVQIVRSQLNA